jgi:hypothetical protein
MLDGNNLVRAPEKREDHPMTPDERTFLTLVVLGVCVAAVGWLIELDKA